MGYIELMPPSDDSSFLKSLGFPGLKVHHASNHFDFRIPDRRILVIGPMGSGKTEFSARVWRDSRILSQKSEVVTRFTRTGEADRRQVFFVRSALDTARFPQYPENALAYRSGFEVLGERLARIQNSFELEKLIEVHPETGTWIIDEASFYEERLAYVVKEMGEKRHLSFIFPTLVLNFRKEVFNPTARLLLEFATDVFPLTAYCEHPDCLEDAFYTYRWYQIEGLECPAPFFDPLIVIGGDRLAESPLNPNYCTRCDTHHYLPGKDYTYLTLKPLGDKYLSGNKESLKQELYQLKSEPERSLLGQSLVSASEMEKRILKIPCLAEKALLYLFVERNLLPADDFVNLVNLLHLDEDYLLKCLEDNGRTFLAFSESRSSL